MTSDNIVSSAIAELQTKGFCVLKRHFAPSLLKNCREAFWPILTGYIAEHIERPNRGPNRHFLAMPFHPPCFAPEFFFDARILGIARGLMGDNIVADQWGCDAPISGAQYQQPHADYRRPLFPEHPHLDLPFYMLVVSFGLVDIGLENGPIEIAPGTHRMPRDEAMDAIEMRKIELEPVLLDIGDVLIRHPWALHRGSPNRSDQPRPLLTIRYVRDWYADFSRDVRAIPVNIWTALTPEQQSLLRYPVEAA